MSDSVQVLQVSASKAVGMNQIYWRKAGIKLFVPVGRGVMVHRTCPRLAVIALATATGARYVQPLADLRYLADMLILMSSLTPFYSGCGCLWPTASLTRSRESPSGGDNGELKGPEVTIGGPSPQSMPKSPLRKGVWLHQK